MSVNHKANINKVSLLFETSWEVCNKIGGIYTVLSTKAKTLQTLLSDRLVFIGPDVWSASNPSPYFLKLNEKGAIEAASDGVLPLCEDEMPSSDIALQLSKAAKALNGKIAHGITFRAGRWNIPGQPLVVLVKFDGVYPELNSYYYQMWQRYGVDSLQAYGDYPEGCAFAIASALTIKAIAEYLRIDQAGAISHFNEWTSAMGLLLSEQITPEIATVFTTHATSIGRSICGNGKPLYDYFTLYHGDQMAEQLNMKAKHSLEKTAAHRADCFTTVSNVTAAECRQLLDIYPGEVTPNGFEPNFVPDARRYKARRTRARKAMLKIAESLTGKQFVDSETFIVATSGRNEYRNKGIDLFIDSLNELRGNFPDCSRKNLVAFIMVPAWVREPQKSLLTVLQGKSASGPEINYLTHRLNNEDSDNIMNHLRRLNVNLREDRVTFVYLPCYLDGKDGVLDIPYYEMVPGLDATVFPSYYEPWGYTPLESIAFGVPTVSTDKAGFGEWIISTTDNTFEGCGAKIVARTDSNYSQACADIASLLSNLLGASPSETQTIRKAARATAARANWSRFVAYYIEAFDKAFSARGCRVAKEFPALAEQYQKRIAKRPSKKSTTTK